jgi:hypothetical protein
MQNIENDISGHSIHEIKTDSAVNQITMIQNSTKIAIATEKGITIQDLSHTLTNAIPRE